MLPAGLARAYAGTLSAALPVGVLLVGPDRRVVWASALACALLGVEPSDVLGVDRRELELAEGRPQDAAPALVRVPPRAWRRERWIERTVQALAVGPLAGGELECLVDVTDREHALAGTARLERALEDQRMILENLAGFTYRHGVDGVFHYLSPSVERTTGYSPDEWKQHYTTYLTDNPLNQRVVENTEVALRSGRPSPPYRVEVRHRDGSSVMLEVSERPYFERGRVAGIVGLALDITDREQLASRVQHVQKLESLGVLAGGVAHDFNNLLMVIRGNADLALEDLPAGSPVREPLEEIVLTARRATEVCRQMLAYSGKGTTRLEEVDLSEVVAEMARMLEVSISKKTRLVYELGRDLPRALGDPTQVRQVVLNLITNASEALGEEPGTVHLRTGAGYVTREELKGGLSAPEPVAGTYVWLEVEDTGCGMDDHTLELMFDPFFSTKFVGRGLGLSTVLGILRGHEGAIRIWSRPGQGTRFRVLFSAAPDGVSAPPQDETPFEEPAAVASPFVPASPSPSPRPRAGLVLLVDDEPAVLKVGASMLRRLGYEVVTASDGRSGLETFERRHDELSFCVLDMSMPEMGGDQVFRAMRALVPKVRVILTSGYDEGEAAKRMGRGLRYRFLQKPFSAQELEQAVRELLGAGRNPA